MKQDNAPGIIQRTKDTIARLKLDLERDDVKDKYALSNYIIALDKTLPVV